MNQFIKDKIVFFKINIANTLTLTNVICGFTSIILSSNKLFFEASIMILAGVIFDYLDGKAARMLNQTSDLGKELDSLSDVITFGVAPAVLVAMIHPSIATYVFGGVYVFSSTLRLGRFNIQRIKGVFVGIPTTINGVLLPTMILLNTPSEVFPVYLLIMAFLMNAPINIKKFF